MSWSAGPALTFVLGLKLESAGSLCSFKWELRGLETTIYVRCAHGHPGVIESRRCQVAPTKASYKLEMNISVSFLTVRTWFSNHHYIDHLVHPGTHRDCSRIKCVNQYQPQTTIFSVWCLWVCTQSSEHCFSLIQRWFCEFLVAFGPFLHILGLRDTILFLKP